MISNWRSLACSIATTCLMLLVVVGCDLGTTSQTTATTPAASTTSAPAPTAITDEVTTVTATEATTTSADTTTATSAVETTEVATAEATSAPTSSVPQGGTLSVRIPQALPDLKPWDLRSRSEEYVADLMYNGLVRLDVSLMPQPDLAERWQTSPDGGTITFTLRRDLQWHDGEPLTEEDVTWTLNTLRVITPTNALMVDLRAIIGEVRAPVSNTVVLSLTQAYAPILADLAVPILPRHRLQALSPDQIATLDFWDEPVGSGPFQLDERNEQGYSFVRNDDYVHGAPNLERVALVVAPDPAVATRALDDGTLLLAEFAITETVSTESLADDITQGAYPENGLYFLAFNTRAERPFADARVRQAVALTVDVPALVREIAGPRSTPLVAAISPASRAYPQREAPLALDLDRARQLLDEAGWTLPAGQSVRARGQTPLAAQIFVRGDDPRRVAAAQRIADSVTQIGMQLTVARVDWETVLIGKLAPPYDFDLLLGSWIDAPNSAGVPTSRFYDADDYALFGADRIWTGQGDTRQGLRNIGGFNNADYEAAAQRARTTYDTTERLQAIAAAQEVVRRELPYLFLWTDRVPVALSASVRSDDGDIPLDSPRYFWNIERWYLEKGDGE
jgi:peptide/nickel transport system substrate-binding protein